MALVVAAIAVVGMISPQRAAAVEETTTMEAVEITLPLLGLEVAVVEAPAVQGATLVPQVGI